ncbi:hypothetical protein RJ639_012417 [Escallonia herrerae]|uniref:U-box domain-containing protein n=1 Tax=Escallonia herrerae TaxID=1293975 RepID=A0AA89AQ83_9ASTE|nr:hypothetical protein RJ639_020168 [Escallonia herrerae]KAK3010153.1 hypothetical protein RJ639_012417 [Escallonia herrerae]
MRRDDLCITVPDFAGRHEIPCEPVHGGDLRPLQHPALARQRQQHVSRHHAGPPHQGLRPQPHPPPPHPDLVRLGPHSFLPESDSPTPDQARHLVDQIQRNPSGDSCFRCISKLSSFANDSDQNRKLLASTDGFLALLFGILGKQTDNVFFAEKIVRLCYVIVEEYGADKEQLVKLVIQKDSLSSMLLLLKQGSLDSKIATARVLELISVDLESKVCVAEYKDILVELLRLASYESDTSAVEVGLSCLVSISMPKKTRIRLVDLGAVKVLAKMVSGSAMSASVVEKVLKLIEMVSACKEGRAEICEDEVCVEAIVKKVLKVSSVATEHAVSILWSLCCLFRDHKAQEAVARSNGLAKILVLMQSNCSPAVRQMSGDLLKRFRVNSKCCQSSYDTKTTHIMPF